MRNHFFVVLVGSLFAAFFAAGVVFGPMQAADASSTPNRITTRAACKKYTSGGAQDSCIACVKQGMDYFRDTGECRR